MSYLIFMGVYGLSGILMCTRASPFRTQVSMLSSNPESVLHLASTSISQVKDISLACPDGS